MRTPPRSFTRTAALLATVLIGALASLVAPGTAYAAGCGTDTDFQLTDKEWELKRLRPETAWPLTEGQGQVVAVIDSGVSVDHPLLTDQVLGGTDLVGDDPHCDNVSHGTVIAGIVAAEYRQDGQLFYGIAPRARILPVRVWEDENSKNDEETPARIAEGIRWAADNGATVINLSLRTPDTEDMREAVEYAVSKDIVVVAAAGNLSEQINNGDTVYPAAYDGVIAVGGIDEAGNHVPDSNAASFVDIAAPGIRITAPAPQGGGFGYVTEGGTSFATAFVSGTAALVRSYHKDLSAEAVIERIIATADDAPGGWTPQLGHGVVNPYEAVAALNVGTAAAPTGAKQPIPVPKAAVDPLAGLKTAASLVAVAAVAIVVITLVAAGVYRHVHRGRGPRRPSARTGAATASPGPSYVIGALSVTGPNVRRPIKDADVYQGDMTPQERRAQRERERERRGSSE